MFDMPCQPQPTCYLRFICLRNPNTTARAALSSRPISSSRKVRVFGCPQNSLIQSARSKSGSRRWWRSSAAGAGPSPNRALESFVLT
jgi:hypothetical protein